MQALAPPSLDAVRSARRRIEGMVTRTPLIRLELDGVSPEMPFEIFVKLENLQPIGSFKLRGAANAMALVDQDALARQGVLTASAGNMAQGVAWAARRLGVSCKVVIPDHAPQAKRGAIARLGGEVIPVPFDTWWRVMCEHRFPGAEGVFIHPVCDPAVIAGNGTVALEILEDLPDVDTVLVPFGGGGLSCGIAAALRALAPNTRVWACEVATAAPLAASLAANEPREVAYTPSFIDGIGAKTLLAPMWPMARDLLAGSVVVQLSEVAAAVRLLIERVKVVAEGAGAVSLAAAFSGRLAAKKVVCVVSGGNIDRARLIEILGG